FVAIDYTITVAETENGTVAADKATANIGETVTLTVTPATGYELETLTYTVEGEDPVAIENYQFVMPAANVTINATFAAIDYTITVAETENGTVEADKATANMGETVTLTVTPAEGYELASLSVMAGETAVDVTEENTFVMPAADVTVTAEFQIIPIVLDGVKFDGNVYATWYGDRDLALPEGVTAYVVTGIEGDVSLIEAVEYIPANVGVLLYSTIPAETVSTVPYTGETVNVTSMLVGGLEDMAITDGYVLVNDNFVRTLSGTLAAHRCYLPVAEPSGAPMRLRIVERGEIITAINDVRATDGNVRYIDINGRVSDKPFNGINIVVNADGTVTKMVK
ncbi:MAG: hypothetical protein IKR25_13815, partial [Muribaculaceae bacterium]|nr:hypothetical protein [Muribaculaceae bacterium]